MSSPPQPICQETATPGCLESATFPGPAVTIITSLNPNAVLWPLPTVMWRSFILTSAKSASFLMSLILSPPQILPTSRSNSIVATATGIPWEHRGSVRGGTLVLFEIIDRLFNMVCKSSTSIVKTALSLLFFLWISMLTFPLSCHRGSPCSWFLAASNDSHLGSLDFPLSETWWTINHYSVHTAHCYKHMQQFKKTMLLVQNYLGFLSYFLQNLLWNIQNWVYLIWKQPWSRL